jgi:hypothetical protein
LPKKPGQPSQPTKGPNPGQQPQPANGKNAGQSSQEADRRFSINGLTREEQLKLTELLTQLKTAQSDRAIWQERAEWSERMSQPGRQYVTKSQAEADRTRLRASLLDDATIALKILRETRDPAAREKAADALQEALKALGVPAKQPERSNR